VQNPDFTLSVSPSSQTVNRGSRTSYTVTIARSGGFTGSVQLSLSGLKRGTSGSFSPNPIGSAATTSTLSISANRWAATGTFTLTVTAASGTISHTTQVTLKVQ
jgi:hypothetical protein